MPFWVTRTMSNLVVLVELPDLDYKQMDRLIAHKRHARTPSHSAIIPHKSKSVKPPATYISEDGEIVAKQIRQFQKHLSKKEVAEIIAAYQSGKSANVLAEEYDCDRHTICDHLKRHGIRVTRNKARSKEAVRKIIALYEKGKLIAEIAEQYEVSDSTINRLLRENGVRIRSRWDYKRQGCV